MAMVSEAELVAQGKLQNVVYFKFKHQNTLDKIAFNAADIAVGELKLLIAEKKECDARDLQLYEMDESTTENAAAGEPGRLYDYDGELIPANATLLVTRKPSVGRQSRGVKVKGNIVVEHARYFKSADGEDGSSSPSQDNKEGKSRERIAKVPETCVCPICNNLMLALSLDLFIGFEVESIGQTDEIHMAPEHSPLLLPCCGGTVCKACLTDACPLNYVEACRLTKYGEGDDKKKPVEHKIVAAQLASILHSYSSYDFNRSTCGFDYPEGLLDKAEARKEETVREMMEKEEGKKKRKKRGDDDDDDDIIDITDDEGDDAVVDLDDDEALQKKARKYRPTVDLIKKEKVKMEKKEEMKDEDDDEHWRTVEKNMMGGGRRRPHHRVDKPCPVSGCLVMFPKVLSQEQFDRWKKIMEERKSVSPSSPSDSSVTEGDEMNSSEVT
ncbi:hypothetical protein FOL47_009894 [Perkinsus chesapeaki]|uniref:DWNN domain-containing protein n=1 Tax=Perkinsus chesapeaki TaxID=330153 RepID=A0A7J6MRF6_PERCH|nr:hypothetical protein FOL47_009894 [Perkinsus chesapeaki]